MTLLSPNHNHAADECIAQIPQHHIPTQDEKVRASENFDKSVLVAAHMAALHDAYILEMATHPVNEVNIKPASPTSSIGGLKPSTLKQLKIGKVHRRRVVNGTLCSRTLCTKTNDGLMVVNVLEDEEGKATPIYLCNAMEGNGGSAQAQRFYPQDSKVAVKEPYLTRLPDGVVVLLVEKMTDLVFLWVPDYVEENGGSKDHGIDGRDVFAMEKKGDEDSMVDGDGKTADNGDAPVNSAADEDAKSSSASRELKFDDMVGAKVNIAKDVDDESTQKDAASGAVAEKGTPDASENGGGNTEDKMDEEDQGKEVVKIDEVSRELSMEDMMSVRKNDGDIGDVDKSKLADREEDKVSETNDDGGGVEKAKDADGKEDKVSVLNDEAAGEEESVHEGVVEQEVPQRTRGVDVDAGETSASLRSKGNALFAREEYNKAIDMYMRAAEKARMDKQQKEEVLCLSNRAEVWLRLCRNQSALDDADAALKILRELEEDANAKGDLDLATAKALFRKGRALMGLHKYEDAMRVLQEVLGKAPADRQLREAATKCRDRLQRVLKPGKKQRAAMNRKKSASFLVQ